MKLNLSKSDGVKHKLSGFKLDNLKKTFFLRVFIFDFSTRGLCPLAGILGVKKKPA